MKKITCLVITMMMILSVVQVKGAVVGESEITPLYTNTSSVTALLSVSGSTATCKAVNVMTKNYPSKITMTLQKSSDKNTYSKVTSWSQSYTGTGTKNLSKTYALTKGYYYRVKVVIRVYSGDTVIEKITKYSGVKYY